MAKGSALKIKYYLSGELAEIIGKEVATRPEVTKKLWDYIKRHGLQSEDDKRVIEPDEVLAEVLGSRPIHMLKLQGKLSAHMEKAE